MANRESNILFDDLFTITAIDSEGKKFDRVSRLHAHSSNFDMSLVLDYNLELYPLYVGDTFTFVLASSLSRGGMVDEENMQASWRPGGISKGIDEDYEYVMHGRVYKFDDAADAKV
ncbi:DNA-directed RNA polymerases I, II, and III subunit RPABC3 [Tulasnella sp. 331]|nr:DNA-directed RNA polymerases I, II, and III subunit RPABC3 [Tulasnella sp. 331]